MTHTHICETCRHEWECLMTSRCQVLTAVKVNKQGPFCGLCMHLEMARRFAEGRGITLRVEQFRVPAQTTGEPETAGAVDPADGIGQEGPRA